MAVIEFWMSVKDEYPVLSAKTLVVLIPFATSYLCEAEFSAVAVLKSKCHVKINVEQEMRVAVSSDCKVGEAVQSPTGAHTTL
jgi:hypothetical protein